LVNNIGGVLEENTKLALDTYIELLEEVCPL
jgi:hypothetical protein